MEKEDSARIVELLAEIRDNQSAQLDISRGHFERAERLQDRVEDLQTRGMGIMKTARGAIAIVLPVAILLVIYLSWLLFR